MDNCTTTSNFCLSCNGQASWINSAKFPQTDASYNNIKQKL